MNKEGRKRIKDASLKFASKKLLEQPLEIRQAPTPTAEVT
jgi:hypothetical protein